MPEEIEEIEDLKKEGITLKEEDIMKPEPSSEQVALWEELDKIITEKVLERDNLFGSLAKDIRNSLTSEYTSNKLMGIGQKYNLSKDQVIVLARYIKSLFIDISKEKFETPQLIDSLRSDLDVDPEKAQALFQEINNEILLPTLKDIPTESPPQKPVQSNKEPNIVDLKKLNHE